MAKYDYKRNYEELLTPGIVARLVRVHEFKGRQALLERTPSEALSRMCREAAIDGVDAMMRRAGHVIPRERLELLIRDKTLPRTNDEIAAAGYRDARAIVLHDSAFLPFKPSSLLQLHAVLHTFSGTTDGGTYRPDCGMAEAVEALCTAYEEAMKAPDVDPFLLVAAVLRDFGRLAPFPDANGRMTALIGHLLLNQTGLRIGRYDALEKRFVEMDFAADEPLSVTTLAFLDRLLAACRTFSDRCEEAARLKAPKTDRVAELIRETDGTVSKAEILERCPDISRITVQRTLADLLAERRIVKIGGGRYTTYRWNKRNKKK